MKPLDKKARCPKCDHKKVAISYHERSSMYQPCYTADQGEHFDRRCLLCGHTWREAVPARQEVDLS